VENLEEESGRGRIRQEGREGAQKGADTRTAIGGRPQGCAGALVEAEAGGRILTAMSPLGEINALLFDVRRQLDGGSQRKIDCVSEIVKKMSLDLQECREENEQLLADVSALKAKLAPKEGD
jgi:hypothetical protein